MKEYNAIHENEIMEYRKNSDKLVVYLIFLYMSEPILAEKCGTSIDIVWVTRIHLQILREKQIKSKDGTQMQKL